MVILLISQHSCINAFRIKVTNDAVDNHDFFKMHIMRGTFPTRPDHKISLAQVTKKRPVLFLVITGHIYMHKVPIFRYYAYSRYLPTLAINMHGKVQISV